MNKIKTQPILTDILLDHNESHKVKSSMRENESELLGSPKINDYENCYMDYMEELSKDDNDETMQEVQILKSNLEKIKNSNLQVNVKIRLMESIRDLLMTKLKRMNESNRYLKEKMVDANHDYKNTTSNYVNTPSHIQTSNLEGQQQHNHNEINHVKDKSEKIMGISSEENKKRGEKQEHHRGNWCINSMSTVESSEDMKEIEDLVEKNKTLEDMIIKLKNDRNLLTMNIDDLKDTLSQLQNIYQEKRNNLQKQTQMIDELTQKISTHSINSLKSSTAPALQKSSLLSSNIMPSSNNITLTSKLKNLITEHIYHTDMSTNSMQHNKNSLQFDETASVNSSRLSQNSSMIAGVGNSLKNFISSKFLSKKKQNDIILSTNILQDQSSYNVRYEEKRSR